MAHKHAGRALNRAVLESPRLGAKLARSRERAEGR